MLIKHLDDLSPKITLYYSSMKSHKSSISGVLTVLHYFSLVVMSAYYFSKVFLRKSHTSFYYRAYTEDPGINKLNSSSFFHYLTFKDNFEYDPRAMTVIGAEMSPSQALIVEDEESFDHWHYSMCNLTNSASEEIQPILKHETGLCVTEFYNSTLRQKFKNGEKGFISPSIHHGRGNEESIPYGILFLECQNTTKTPLKEICYDKAEIKQYVKGLYSVVMNVMDQYVDVNDFSNPLVSFINSFETGVMPTAITISYTNFNLQNIKTHSGVFFRKTTNIEGYIFEQVVRGSYEKGDHGILTMFFFYMGNQINYYERNYLQFIDVLATLSGIYKLSSVFFLTINFIVHRTFVINDFGSFLEAVTNKAKVKHALNINSSSMKEVSCFVKKNDTIKTSEIVQPKEMKKKKCLKVRKTTYLQVFKALLRLGHNFYIVRLTRLRMKILSEERMVKYYLSWKSNKRKLLKESTVNNNHLQILGNPRAGDLGKHAISILTSQNMSSNNNSNNVINNSNTNIDFLGKINNNGI